MQSSGIVKVCLTLPVSLSLTTCSTFLPSGTTSIERLIASDILLPLALTVSGCWPILRALMRNLTPVTSFGFSSSERRLPPSISSNHGSGCNSSFTVCGVFR